MNTLLENSSWILIVGFLFAGSYGAAFFYWSGRKAEVRFCQTPNPTIVFRERGASGNSKKSAITRMGGANRVLEVVVRDNELWIKGIWRIFTFIGSMYDLTHRVSLSWIREVNTNGHKVSLRFSNEVGEESHVELRLRDANAFIAAIGA